MPPTVIVSFYCPLICLSHFLLLLSSLRCNPSTPNLPPPPLSVLPLCDTQCKLTVSLLITFTSKKDPLAQKTCHPSVAIVLLPQDVQSPFFHPPQSLLPTASLRLFLFVFFYLPHLQTFSLSTLHHDDPSLWAFAFGTFLSTTKPCLCTHSSTHLNLQPSLLSTYNFL